MSETKWTPGPWFATPVPDKHSDDGPEFWLIDAVPAPNQETEVAEICHKLGERSKANAHLITAAPESIQDTDLLAREYDRLMDWAGTVFEKHDDDFPLKIEVTLGDLRRAHTTSAKARGEQTND